MPTENIINEVLSGNISSAKMETEELLYSKLNETLQGMKKDIVSGTYEDSIGVASLAEKRKEKKNGNGDD